MTKKNNKIAFPYNRRNISISFNVEGEPQYFVDEKKKRVTCVLSARLNTPVPVDYPGVETPMITPQLYKVSARANCSDKDVFNAERGMRIALAKAEMKVYRQAAEYIVRESEFILHMATACTDFLTNAAAFAWHNTGHIEALSDTESPEYIEKLRPLKHGVVINKD